ncbi:MAG: hypothetical protein K1W12_02425 [Turicimonas muris]
MTSALYSFFGTKKRKMHSPKTVLTRLFLISENSIYYQKVEHY